MGQNFLSDFNKNLTSKPVEELKNGSLISEIECGNVRFLSVIQSIEELLTNENVTIREKGVEFLSWILSEIASDLFNMNEISVLANFYCGCLKGHHNILPSTIKGILGMVKFKQISGNEIIKILGHLFQHVNCQTQLQPDRYNIFSILKIVLEKFLTDLKRMGPDLVYGLISFIEGETDPKNLLLIFNTLPTFIKNFDLGHLKDEMFEMLSCYFPIDFNSTKGHCSVTREDLAEGLIACLSASDSFCEQVVVLVLEKLDSSFKTAKLDSYKLIQACCKTSNVIILEKHLNELWKVIQKDILPGNDKQICEAGLSTLSDLIRSLSKEENHKQILITFVGDILITVKSLLNSIDGNMFQPAVNIVMTISASSNIATVEILKSLKPFYDTKINWTTSENKLILSAVLPLLKFCAIYRIAESVDEEAFLSYSALVNFYLLFATSDDYELRKISFQGLLHLVGDSNESFRNKLFEIIMENINKYEDIRTSVEFSNIWRRLAEVYSAEFYGILSTHSDLISKNKNESFLSRFLWALSFIAFYSNFTDFVIPTFISNITANHPVEALESLLNGCRLAKNNDCNSFFYKLHSDYNIVKVLIFWCQSSERTVLNEKMLAVLSEIIALTVRNQSVDTQKTIVDSYVNIFLTDTVSSDEGVIFSLRFGSELILDIISTVVILEAILGSVQREILTPQIFVITEKLTHLALKSSHDQIRLSSSRLLASFVNKSKEPLSSDLLGKVFDVIKEIERDTDSQLKSNFAFLISWLMKGVLLRGDVSAPYWILKWFDLLGKKDLGHAIALGFQIVTEEDALYLNTDSHNLVKVLYRQRLFQNLPDLIKIYEKSDCTVKANYLLALVKLLQGVPSSLIQMEIAQVVPLLVKCLETDKPEILLTSLVILKNSLPSRDNIFVDHIQSFVQKFLKLAAFQNCMKIRINALNCLYLYAFYPTLTVLKLKNQVLYELKPCLDDKKRLVRKEAVRARCRWFLVGAPGEDIVNS